MTVLLVVNAVLLVGSAGYGVVALIRPGTLAGSPVGGPAAAFYARMYASRALPLGLVGAGAVLASTDDPRTCAAWVGLAGVVQLADAAIGAARRTVGMIVGPAVVAVVHLMTFALVLTR